MRIRARVSSAATSTEAERCCEVSPRNVMTGASASIAANVSGQRDVGPQRGAAAGRAVAGQAPAQRLDAVGEAAQPGAAGGVRAADAVVGDLDQRVAVLAGHL